MANVLIYQDSESGKMLDVSSLANSIQHYTDIGSQPGKLSFTLKEDPTGMLDRISMGSMMVLRGSSGVLFRGRVFSASTDGNGGWEVVAYDTKRYLKNKDTISCVDMTLGKLVSSIANAAGIPCKVSVSSGFKLEDKLYQSKTYFEMLEDAFSQVFDQTGNYLFLRDKDGVLEVSEPRTNVTSAYVGEGSNLTGYSYSEDIDTDTFTKIMLFRKDKKTGKLKMLDPQQDLRAATLWGVLQDEKTFGDETSEEQALQYGKTFIAVRSRIRKSVSIKALNVDGLNAGDGFYFAIPSRGITQSVYITRATHYYDEDLPTMDLEVSLIV